LGRLSSGACAVALRQGAVMNATELIYHAAGSPPVDTVTAEGVCAVCAAAITEGIPIKKVVSGNFSDWNVLADMAASHVCKACKWCIKEPKMRRSQYIATEQELIYFKRDDIEKYLFTPPEPPFVFFVTSSYKKHGSFRARVNDSRKLFYVQFEDKQILFSPNKYKEVFELMKRMYLIFNKVMEIGKGQYIHKRVFEYGLSNWKRDEAILEQYRGSLVFELLLYALNKPEDTKNGNRM
jgi:CRISPR type IV-associated protein Csf1